MARGLLLWLLPVLVWFSSYVSAASTITNATELLSELSKVPKCALQCATLLPSTSCSLTDLNCLCTAGNPTNITAPVQTCVLETCTIREALEVQAILENICGVPIRREGPLVQGVAIAFTAVVYLTFLIRLGVRSRNWKLFGWDDALIFMATALAAPLCACVIMLVQHGLGTSLWGVPYEDVEGIFQWFWVGELCYIASTNLTKLSVLFFYIRVFTEKSFLWKTYVLLGLTTAFFIGCFLSAIFQCSPVDFAWHYWDKLHVGHCINLHDLLWANSLINIILDGLIILLPIPTLWSLTLPTLRKIGLLLMFSLGALTMVVGALRLHVFDRARVNMLDLTFDLRLAAVWSIVEVDVGIICVCLPAMRPFLRAIRDFIFGAPLKDRYEQAEFKLSARGGSTTFVRSMADSEKSKATTLVSSTPYSRSESTEELRDGRPF